MKYLLIFLAFFMLASPVYADEHGGGEGDNTNCNGQGNPNSPCDGGDGGNGGGGGEGGGGGGGSGGTGGNSSIDVGDVTVTTGDSTSDSTATATGGSIYIGGEEGEGSLNSNAENNVDVSTDSSSESAANSESNNDNDNSNDVENNVTVEGDNYQAADIPVNSAPPSFSAICSSGAAGSGSKFSLSLAVTNDVCQALMMADAYMAIGDEEEAIKWVKAAARHAKWKGGLGYFRHVITLGVL